MTWLKPEGTIRTVLGDIDPADVQVTYAHEHFVIDSPFIAVAFPHIHLFDVNAAIEELSECRESGVDLAIDAMPCASGRRIDRLVAISKGSGVAIVASTGLHHDRYYGENHWSNQVGVDALVELFIADLLEGIDAYDYTGPIVQRTVYRAGVIKVATSGIDLDARDARNLEAAARASLATGAPILTHCEGGRGALRQIDTLQGWGVPVTSILLSHIDKPRDLGYLRAVASSGAILELDQALRDAGDGAAGFTVQAIATLVSEGAGHQIVVGTDGARRSLWRSLGGQPGLAWLADRMPSLLHEVGLSPEQIVSVMGRNAAAALKWRKKAT